MRKWLQTFGAAAAILLAPSGAASAQVTNVPALPEPGAIPLYPGDRQGSASDEVWTKLGPTVVIRNVTRPTLTPILPPPDKATGAAVILAPGGGMVFLAMPQNQIAKTLVERGIAVFVLKYRVVPTPPDVPGLMVKLHELQDRSRTGEVILSNPEGNADAQAAVALVRANASKWRIDAHRVGLLGFSSGAQVSRVAALSDKPEGRPDFVGLIYGAMDAVAVPATAPPMFAAIAMDDATVPNAGFPVVESWRRAHRLVELHAYQTGGHGFAQGGPDATHRLYLEQFIAWLAMQGFLDPPATGAAK
ncbi:MAG: alpha/beta hydrolase [Novosphingobium sp.]